MDTTEALESIARTLPNLLPETVESMLVTYDTLAGLGDSGSRPTAARFLRDAAVRCDETRKERLLQAAAAVEAGNPCALTPEGLTGAQAAAAQTITLEEWQARSGDPDWVAPAGQADAEEPPEIMEQEPPRLPRLRVPHFFSGLVVRAGRELRDVYGREALAGQVVRLLTFEHSDDDNQTALHFLELSLRLNASTPDYEAIVENRGNEWFQPLPSVECLEDLCEAIDRRLAAAEDSDEDDDDDGPDERVEEIREDVEKCQDWLAKEAPRGPAPECTSGRVAAQVFGRGDAMAAWVPLLFAGIGHVE